MQTTTAPKAGNAPDLLQGILSVQVRNEDKITEQDRLYTKPNVSSITKKTARFPCVISTLTITTGKTIHTTSSNRLI